ncbi:protein fuzzy homolog [Clytia hemisphaerica]|uniref:FUZ/MON1/HPS1 first Longin domain-containing protein n=1 Tax=Clytia hemisphaerica TaxID=252671 RepID=A0A7M5VDD0_9CNID|eukprot:TCONS_00026395-protein
MKSNEPREGGIKSTDSLIKFSLHCLTVNGIPLFSKNIGHSSTVPFPVIGSLNGVQMFAKSKGVESGLTRTETGVVFWKEYETVKFILLVFENKCNERFLETLLENLYKSLIMSIGETELTKSNNVERLKKKMKLCSPLLDAMLAPSKITATLTQTTETLHISNSSVLINYLTSFTEDLDSEFGCITVDGRVVVATEKFWQLQTIETSLLSYVVYNLRNATASDTPVYLPNGSPVVPHRLITVTLIDHVQIAIVCGPEPSLHEIQNKLIVHYWLPLVPYLRECLRSLPRSFPPEIKPDHNVISVILLNTVEGKSLISFHTHGNNTAIDMDEMSSKDVRKNALLDFYLSANNFLKINNDDETDDSSAANVSETKETYQCYTTHKCYALKTASYEIYVLFSRLVPTYSMGFLTKATLKMLTKDRS